MTDGRRVKMKQWNFGDELGVTNPRFLVTFDRKATSLFVRSGTVYGDIREFLMDHAADMYEHRLADPEAIDEDGSTCTSFWHLGMDSGNRIDVQIALEGDRVRIKDIHDGELVLPIALAMERQ